MYKTVSRFMTSSPGRDTTSSQQWLLKPLKLNRQELLIEAGMGAIDEAMFMKRVQAELRKQVGQGVRNPKLQAEKLNKLGILTATRSRWDAAKVIMFYERQKTRNIFKS